jgi:hypothetical protein
VTTRVPLTAATTRTDPAVHARTKRIPRMSLPPHPPPSVPRSVPTAFPVNCTAPSILQGCG